MLIGYCRISAASAAESVVSAFDCLAVVSGEVLDVELLVVVSAAGSAGLLTVD